MKRNEGEGTRKFRDYKMRSFIIIPFSKYHWIYNLKGEKMCGDV
jgi:hypothetical protein